MSRYSKAIGITAAMIVVALVVYPLSGIRLAGIPPTNTDATTGTVRGGGDAALFPPPWSAAPAAGLALTPPMGWNGFNRFYVNVNEWTVQAAARALISSGMKAAGYKYVNLDGGWALRERNAAGAVVADPHKFPHGIGLLADYVHSLGLMFGIYISAGVVNCAGTSVGSYGHYRQDAAAFASWHVDYLKLDWCNVPYSNYPGMTHRQVSQMLAAEMGYALGATGRAMVYDVNGHANEEPWGWAPPLAHMWRTTPDIHDGYPSLLWNFSHNVSHFKQAGPAAWNDPDMLEVGNGGMTMAEYQTQFSLWAEMAAPLIAGNDLTTMSEATRSILMNKAVIAVDQDPLGRQGYPIASVGGHWVLTKPMANGDRTVVLFNQTDSPATISTTVTQVGLMAGRQYALLNLWTGVATDTAGAITATVPAHGVAMFEISESPSSSPRSDWSSV